MRLIAAIFLGFVAASFAMRELCGTATCPPNPSVLSCNDKLCYSDSPADDATPGNSVIYYAHRDSLYSWLRQPSILALTQVREIFAFQNDSVVIAGFNPNRPSGLFFSPSGKQMPYPVGNFPIINSLRHVRPNSAADPAYVIGMGTDETYERIGAIAIGPDGDHTVWNFPSTFVSTHGYPGVLHSVQEGIWLVTTARVNPQAPFGNIHRSADFGKTWTTLIKTPTPTDFIDVACCPGGGLCAAIGTNSTNAVVYVSKDVGKTWTLSFETSPALFLAINRIRVAFKTETIIFTTCQGQTRSECSGIAYFSQDQGASWSEVQPANNGTHLRGMEIGPDGESVIIAGRNVNEFGTFSVLRFDDELLV